MENEKFENQKNSNNDIGSVSGGKALMHVDTSSPDVPAKVDSIYLGLRDTFNLMLVGAIDRNGIDLDRKIVRDDGARLLNKIVSKSKLTTRRKRPWEFKFKLYHSNSKN